MQAARAWAPTSRRRRLNFGFRNTKRYGGAYRQGGGGTVALGPHSSRQISAYYFDNPVWYSAFIFVTDTALSLANIQWDLKYVLKCGETRLLSKKILRLTQKYFS